MTRERRENASRRTILAIDDRPETLASAKRALEADGHRVATTSLVETALGVVREGRADLLLVGTSVDGTPISEVVDRIREIDPIVPIIVHVADASAIGAQDLLRDLDVQGCHAASDAPERLLQWIPVALRSQAQLARLLQRERQQQELVASCSHEFRTPLNVIGGYAELLSSAYGDQLDDSARRAVGIILDATQGLSDLVTDFLTFAKLQARAVDVSLTPIDVPDLVDELRVFGEALVADTPVAFHATLEASAASLVSDPVKLRTVLRNLIVNAIKFTASGSVTLSITRDGPTTRFAVTDTGCGIPSDQLEHVFDPFAQVEGAPPSGRSGGVGLGLAICRKTAALLGGTLHVESRVGAGSTFVFALPTCAADATAAAVDRE